MRGGVVVSVSVEPAVVATGESTRVTVVIDEALRGAGGLDIALEYQQYPQIRGEDLIALAVDSITMPDGRMSASADLRTARDVAGGRVVVIANPGPTSVSTTLTIEESPGSEPDRSVITGTTFE